jgi:hypothetical protein
VKTIHNTHHFIGRAPKQDFTYIIQVADSIDGRITGTGAFAESFKVNVRHGF